MRCWQCGEVMAVKSREYEALLLSHFCKVVDSGSIDTFTFIESNHCDSAIQITGLFLMLLFNFDSVFLE